MPSYRLKPACWLMLGWLSASAAQAVVYPLPPPDNDVIGQVKVIYATKEDTLLDIARRHSLGYDEMVHANPGVDRWAPGEGTPMVLPTRYILPDTPREGIVLNTAELRLYYYPKAEPGEARVVHTYPVSIGRMDWKTPMGVTRVTSKDTDPAWRPPASIKAEHAKEGDILPDVVPGGADNPLGRHALRLALPSYLIHGTNRPNGIGMRVTHGCVRMYPEDIEGLFGMVPVGTTVRLVDQPVKVGRINGHWLVEAHEPLEEDNIPIKVTLEQATQVVIAKTGPDMPGIDQAALAAVIEQVSGIPASIAALPGSTPPDSFAGPVPAPPQAYPSAGNPTMMQRTPVPMARGNPRPLPYADDDAGYDDEDLPYRTPVQPLPRPVTAAPGYVPNRPGYSPSYSYPPYPAATEPPSTIRPPVYQPYPPPAAANRL
ncbi:MAG TPA: hypothetical protein DCS21_03955 [Gammaproteobacteria bacterium]|nr:hypothetical protein [Gammaproteobacteria bacterium]